MADKRIIVDVDHVTIRFNLASQKIDNLKEYFIKFVKRELMFQEFLAIEDISFQVRAGEAWGLIGTNGSGKSTMLKAISGIIKPYKGTIKVNGSVAPLIELGAGFDPECTARENIFLNGFSLYRLDQIQTDGSGKRPLGDLPTGSIALLCVLISTWACMGIYGISQVVKRKKAKNQ